MRFLPMRKVALLPTLCTLANGVCGFSAILFMLHVGPTVNWNPQIAAYVAGWLIFVAMIFDALDGYIARKTKSASQFGAELDSLCDVVSFGVAPAVMIVQLGADLKSSPLLEVVPRLPDFLYVIAVLYVCCTILRLARFNVTTSTDAKSHRYFQGLPSPGAAGCVAALVILRYNISALDWFQSLATVHTLMGVFTPILAASLAMLMVSKIPYLHVANQVLHRRKKFSQIVQALLIIIVIFWARELALCLTFWGYALWGPAKLLWDRWRNSTPFPGGDAAVVPVSPATS